jgi:hydrogenase-4 component B
MTPGPLLLFAFLTLATGIVVGVRLSRTWLGLTLAGTVVRVERGVDGAAGRPDWYAREYWSDFHYPDSAPRGRAWWSALLLSMGLVLTVSNGLHFLIAWELFAICGYFLITLDRQKREVRAAGWLYLAASHAGTMCLFAFFALLAARTGGWDLGPMREQTGNWRRCSGWRWWDFGVKAGFFRCTSGCPRRTPMRRATSRPSCRAWPSRWASTGSCVSAAGCRCRRRRAGW